MIQEWYVGLALNVLHVMPYQYLVLCNSETVPRRQRCDFPKHMTEFSMVAKAT